MSLNRGFWIANKAILEAMIKNREGKCPICNLKIEVDDKIYIIEQEGISMGVHCKCLEDLTADHIELRELEKAEKVAWVSKHAPLPVQRKALKERFGGLANIIQINKTFENYSEVLDRIIETGAKYAVVVLPLSMTQLLTNDHKAKGITWIEAEMESVHEDRLLGREGSCNKRNCKDYNPETDTVIQTAKVSRHLRFVRYNRILRVEIVKEPF